MKVFRMLFFSTVCLMAMNLNAQQYVDLGLPSGTLWKDKNENGLYIHSAAVRAFGDSLPSKVQLEELKNSCQWTWTGSGYKVVGPNGNSIVLPAEGNHGCYGDVNRVGTGGDYWSSTRDASEGAWGLYFGPSNVGMDSYFRCNHQSVRLVKSK